jgi:hypothetical protein
MVATDGQGAQQPAYKGLLDFLQDEEMRKALGRVGVAATSLQQPFGVVQPTQTVIGGGLLQQPIHPAMTQPGTGIMSLSTQQSEGVDMDKVRSFMKLLGMGEG